MPPLLLDSEKASGLPQRLFFTNAISSAEVLSDTLSLGAVPVLDNVDEVPVLTRLRNVRVVPQKAHREGSEVHHSSFLAAGRRVLLFVTAASIFSSRDRTSSRNVSTGSGCVSGTYLTVLMVPSLPHARA